MKLTHYASLKFALQEAAWGIGINWRAILTIAGLLAFALLAGWYALRGPAKSEQATILGFGIYETETGTRSIVRVRDASGQVRELIASASRLRGCRKGDRVWLVRRFHSLFVDGWGCRPK